MKLTLNIDNTLLERVRKATGSKTKTEAIHYALRETDRRNRLRDLLAEDIGLTSEEWRSAFESTAPDEESAPITQTLPRREPKPRSRR